MTSMIRAISFHTVLHIWVLYATMHSLLLVTALVRAPHHDDTEVLLERMWVESSPSLPSNEPGCRIATAGSL